MQNLPKELLDAAEIDGAGPFYTFWRIVIPLSLPALATLTIISFTGVWNDYFAPLIFLNSNSLYTIQLHVAEMVTPFSGTTFAGTLQQAADFIAAAPIVVLFLLLQPYFIEGITVTGLQ
jgi:multiple sugar transport system permease protein